MSARLKPLGKVLHMSHNGYVVAVIEESHLPSLGTPVYVEGGRRIGVLLDVIGPVNSPFAVIKPDNPEVSVKQGATIYYRPPLRRRPRGKGPRGRRRRRG